MIRVKSLLTLNFVLIVSSLIKIYMSNDIIIPGQFHGEPSNCLVKHRCLPIPKYLPILLDELVLHIISQYMFNPLDTVNFDYDSHSRRYFLAILKHSLQNY